MRVDYQRTFKISYRIAGGIVLLAVLLFAFSVHKVRFEEDFILRGLKHRRPNGSNASKLQTIRGRLGVNYNHTSGLLSIKTVCFLKERVPCLIDFYPNTNQIVFEF